MAGNKQLWLVARQGQAGRTLVADVALRVHAHRTYSYAVPEALRDRVRPGARVRAPYGRSGRIVEGWCLRVSERDWDHTLRPVAEVTGELELAPRLIDLALWVSAYYACPPGRVLDAFVPAAARVRRGRRVRWVQRIDGGDDDRLRERQRALLAAIADGPAPWPTLRERTGVGPAGLRSLVRRGLVEIIERTTGSDAADGGAAGDGAAGDGAAGGGAAGGAADGGAADGGAGAGAPAAEAPPACPEDGFELTAAQREALEAIRAAIDRAANRPAKAAERDPADGFETLLLFGVPGSGKTEVYVRAIRHAIAAGRQAILLVPEIALATQIVERLARRFSRVAVLHSRLPAARRGATFRAIAAGQIDVVIGTRTAVFAPCPRLGLIVVDEEQETSFKSLAAPLYHARDVAVKRGQLEAAPVVLGSATPSLESWHNAQAGRYRLLRLGARVPGARPPRVELVATERRELGQTTRVLSPRLAEAVRSCVQRGEQAILLHNRRGYALRLRCAACGLDVLCPRCDAPLVYHRADESLRCHRCGQRGPLPQRCLDDSCGGRIERYGRGIQQLESELRRLAPHARLVRLDSDTMKRREDYGRALGAFAQREADILIGTQMVAKGLDFPDVRLVGVIDADAALWLPDFRAAEQAFQLLVQVVGRAGRKDGASIALLQADDPQAAVLQAAVRMDYERFAASELAVRRQTGYPPWGRLARCVCADPDAGRARRAAATLSGDLRKLAGRISAQLRVEPADECVVFRRRGRARYQVLIRGPRDDAIQRLLRAAADEKLLSPRTERFTIDVDPVDMM